MEKWCGRSRYAQGTTQATIEVVMLPICQPSNGPINLPNGRYELFSCVSVQGTESEVATYLAWAPGPAETVVDKVAEKRRNGRKKKEKNRVELTDIKALQEF